MTSGRAGGLKNRKPLKADSTEGHLKVAFEGVPGPGARTFCAKTMRHLLFHGPGGPPEFQNADCGMRIEKENSKIRNPQFEIRNSRGRCFLPRSSLPPGHNSSIPEMSNSNRPPAKPGVYLKEIKEEARKLREMAKMKKEPK
jgi:hypothetical protein